MSYDGRGKVCAYWYRGAVKPGLSRHPWDSHLKQGVHAQVRNDNILCKQ